MMPTGFSCGFLTVVFQSLVSGVEKLVDNGVVYFFNKFPFAFEPLPNAFGKDECFPCSVYNAPEAGAEFGEPLSKFSGLGLCEVELSLGTPNILGASYKLHSHLPLFYLLQRDLDALCFCSVVEVYCHESFILAVWTFSCGLGYV